MRLLAAESPTPLEVNSPSFSTIILKTEEELALYRSAWDDLARNALDPNVFYESWMLLPALGAFKNKNVQIVLMLDSRLDEPRLCGLFPLERRWGYKGVPVGYWSMWRHRHVYLCLPLLRAACARECLHAFLDWLRDQRRAALMEWPLLPRGGPTHGLLTEWMGKRARCFVDEEYSRRLLARRGDAETYLQSGLSARLRRDLRRKERGLSQLGHCETRVLGPTDDVQAWIDQFLRVESQGWKGHEGTAMACRPEDRDYFRKIVTQAFERGQLLMLGYS